MARCEPPFSNDERIVNARLFMTFWSDALCATTIALMHFEVWYLISANDSLDCQFSCGIPELMPFGRMRNEMTKVLIARFQRSGTHFLINNMSACRDLLLGMP